MNQRQKHPQQTPKVPAYRQAFERLDAALEKNTPHDNFRKIQLLRRALFGDVAELEASGSVVIPK